MKLVLVDRDGVINEEIDGYVKSPDELIIIPAALEAFALLKKEGFTSVIVTNQSVVGRGIISLETLNSVHAFLCKEIEKHGGKITEVISCTDRPDMATNRRKPGPGMLLEALDKYGAAPGNTPFIGDALTDMEAALAAGCNRFLVMTGKGSESMRKIPEHLHPVTNCTDILDAARKIAINT